MSIVGKKFPDLNVNGMNEMGDTISVNVLKEAVDNKKKVLLFWYPKDFTFVCPTELHAFQAALPEFAAFENGALLNQVQTNKADVLKTFVDEAAAH